MASRTSRVNSGRSWRVLSHQPPPTKTRTGLCSQPSPSLSPIGSQRLTMSSSWKTTSLWTISLFGTHLPSSLTLLPTQSRQDRWSDMASQFTHLSRCSRPGITLSVASKCCQCIVDQFQESSLTSYQEIPTLIPMLCFKRCVKTMRFNMLEHPTQLSKLSTRKDTLTTSGVLQRLRHHKDSSMLMKSLDTLIKHLSAQLDSSDSWCRIKLSRTSSRRELQSSLHSSWTISEGAEKFGTHIKL